MMQNSAAGVSLGLLIALVWADAAAKTVFAVTSEDIAVCSELGEMAGELARLKHRGVPREEMLDAALESGMSPEVGQAVINVLYSFEASDPSVYTSAMGAFCLQDKLAPVELPN